MMAALSADFDGRSTRQAAASPVTGGPSQQEHGTPLLRLMVDRVRDYAIIRLDPAGHVASWNEGAERLHGYTASEILGQHCSVLFSPEDRSLGRPADQLEVARQVGRMEQEGRRVHQDGSLFWAHAVITALRDDEGKLLGYTEVARDITQQYLAQREREQLAAAVRESTDAIIVQDLTGTIIAWNRGAERTYGYAEEEMLSKSLLDIVPSSEHGAAGGLLRAVTHGQPVGSLETKRITWDGRVIDIWLTATALLDADGQPRGVATTERDITDLKLAQTQLERANRELEQIAATLRQSEEELRRHRSQLENLVQQRTAELRRSNEELEQFAYLASHDLKEPLRMVGSYTQLLAEEYAGRLDANADTYIRYAADGARRMQELIDALLQYARIGRADLPLEIVDINEVVRVALLNLEVMRRETGAQIHVDHLPTVSGHPTELMRLFQNLIGNALKFRTDRPPLVTVAAEQRPEHWEIQVEDNGIGIAPEYRERIFHIFQRLHTREEYPGTGMGLALCKKIVEHHGGRIWIESQPGGGTTVHFTLQKTVARLRSTEEVRT